MITRKSQFILKLARKTEDLCLPRHIARRLPRSGVKERDRVFDVHRVLPMRIAHDSFWSFPYFVPSS